MRLLDWPTTALAAAALFQDAFAQQAPGYGQPESSSLTSATTTHYTTMTVLRVEATVTATRNGTVSIYESTSTVSAYKSTSTVAAYKNITTETTALAVPTTLASASSTSPTYSNCTSSVLGTGALPSATASVTGITPFTGSAGKLGSKSLGLVALLGAAGLLLL